LYFIQWKEGYYYRVIRCHFFRRIRFHTDLLVKQIVTVHIDGMPGTLHSATLIH